MSQLKEKDTKTQRLEKEEQEADKKNKRKSLINLKYAFKKDVEEVLEVKTKFEVNILNDV